MGIIHAIQPAKLIVGFIFQKEAAQNKAEELLIKYFGALDFRSHLLDFNRTDYYRDEFGDQLKRKFISFQKLILPQKLSQIKTFTNKIERRVSSDGKRLVNIDPGYLNLAKLVLATTKDYAHRIYLDKGIYGEVTLFYKNNSFRPWEWTYPDYRTPEYLNIFNLIRTIYVQQIKGKP
jgi:hypothetical protein